MHRLFSAFVSIALSAGVFSTGQAGGVAHTRAGFPLMQRGRVASIRFAPRQISEANKKLRYTLKARYPQAIAAGSNPRLTKLNQALRQFIMKEVGGFKKDFSPPEERMLGGESTFDARYQVVYATNDLVSVSFVINTYFEGAVHGNYSDISFNYDLVQGRTLSLADLFQSNANYLKLISDYAIKSLRKELGPDSDLEWIQSGASPEDKNYQSWNLTRKGLAVTFNPYQVASYAEGPHTVVVPYSVLRDVIDSQGPLSRITGK
ncbi:MAG TPA: DUF3298 domain-containing protein [Pyrinomonadaceae bacterium]|nr:DUF3298 domain-containing protein [Pyrinomonadaceae bacterium]